MRAAEARWVNSDILRWARERLQLSRDEVVNEAEKLSGNYYAKFSATTLAQWERGEGTPELEHLETLSEIYLCPVGYFFLDRRPREELPLSFRGLDEQKIDRLGSTTLRVLHQFFDLAQWTVHLISTLELPRIDSQAQTVRLGEIEWPEDGSKFDEFVLRERERFGWTSEVRSQLVGLRETAFEWWRKAIEGRGFFCFMFKLDAGDVRGASMWWHDVPFVLVNHQDAEAATGRIFTLLHEYAHLITARDGLVCDFRGSRGGRNPEPLANRFAARILLQPAEVRQQLSVLGEAHARENWSEELLDRIREPFLVSRDVVAITLEDMGLAPNGFYQRKRQQWERRRPWGRRPGLGRPTNNEIRLRQLGYSLTGILARSAQDPNFPWIDVSHFLDMKVEKSSEFLQWARERL